MRFPHPIVPFDIETYSTTNLKTSGSYAYFEDPNTDILCVCWKTVKGQKMSWRPGAPPPEKLLAHVVQGGFLMAHNVAFDAEGWLKILVPRYGWVWPGYEAFLDSMACACIVNLPAKLEIAAKMFPGPKKSVEGHKLMMKLCRPAAPIAKSTDPKRFHTPENIQGIVDYCHDDVSAEHGFTKHIGALSAFEERVWRATWSMNRRGVRIDIPLVNKCILMASQVRDHYRGELYALTKGAVDSETKRVPLGNFFEAHGVVLPLTEKGNKSMSKGNAHLIEWDDADEDGQEARRLYDLLNKSSLAKFHSMLSCVCEDGRIRGMFVYAGAGQTARWAGRLVQLQNLYRGMVEGQEAYDALRASMRAFDAHEMEFSYPDIMSAIATLIRTALIPAEGNKFIVADYSAIEGRVLAWLVREEHILQAYREGKRMYAVAAAVRFHCTYEQVMRERAEGDSAKDKQGKVMELACFAGDTLVLTAQGWCPMQDVTAFDLVFDGMEFVPCDGVVYRGSKDIIELAGVGVTPDHKILNFEKDYETWTTAEDLSRSTQLLKTATDGAGLLLCLAPLARAAACEISCVNANAVRTLDRIGIMCLRVPPSSVTCAPNKHRLGPISVMHTSALIGSNEEDYLIGSPRHTAAVPTLLIALMLSTALAVYGWTLTPALNSCSISWTSTAALMLVLSWIEWTTIRGMLRGICASFPETRISPTSSKRSGSNTAEKKCPQPCSGEGTVLDTATLTPSSESYEMVPVLKRSSTGRTTAEVHTFDVLNAGTQSRFMILSSEGPMIVHNCGFGGSVNAIDLMGGQDIPLAEKKEMVKSWRAGRPNTVAFWRDCNRAALWCLRNPLRKKRVCRVVFYFDSKDLKIRLPSKRCLVYRRARITERTWDDGNTSPQVTFFGTDSKHPMPGWIDTYGGKICENITQAVARDVLAEAMVACDDLGYELIMTVHDELVADEPKDGRTHEDLCRDMLNSLPEWAAGLPTDVEGFSCDYYRKG